MGDMSFDYVDNKVTTTRGQHYAGSHIIAVGGGKGGVGKTFVSSNLAIFLAHMGYNTYLVDLDLGAANLHTVIGEGLPQKGLADFVKNPEAKLDDVAIATRFPQLKLISGANDRFDMANASINDLTRIMSALYRQPADFVVLDLSAGTHSSTLDFFLMGQTHLVTTTAEPSSVENAYRFMKACFYQKIKRYEKQLHLYEDIQDLMSRSKELGIRSPFDLLKAIKDTNEIQGARLQKVMEKLHFQFVINQIRSPKDNDLGHSMATVGRRYFGVPSTFLGSLEYDNAVWRALRKQQPLILEYPHSHLYNQILRIARNIARPSSKKIVV